MLGNISGTLDLTNKGITSLKANDFAGLSGVTTLNLKDNSLTTLNDGVFNGLSALQLLTVRDNKLATLASGILSPLDALTNLVLTGNELTALPNGFFTNLNAAISLHIHDQFNDPDDGRATLPSVALPVFLIQVGNEVTVSLPVGSLNGDMGFNLSVTGNAASDSPNRVTMPLNATSATVTLKPASGELVANFGNIALGVVLPGAAPSYPGIAFVGTKSVLVFNDVPVTDQQHFEQIAIAPLQLPSADASSFPTNTESSLTYSLTASITSGNDAALANNLPAGLAFDPDTRTLSGTPSALGTYEMTYSAVLGSSSASQTFSVEIQKPVPTFTDAPVDNQRYFQLIAIDPLQLPPANLSQFQGGTAPSLTYSLTVATTKGDEAALTSNLLPAGLAFTPDTRTLSGTPSALGTYTMTYSVMDGDGGGASQNFDIQVDIPLDYDALHVQILSHLAITVADSAGQAVSDRIDRMASRQKPRFNTNGSDFEVPLAEQGSTFTLWLQNSATDLSLNGGDFNWSGDVSGTQFGFDWRSDDSAFLVGLMLQNLDGQFDHSGNLPGTEDITGYYSIPMDSEHVYFGWMPGGVQTSNWLNVWGMVGSGSGSLTMTGLSGEAMRSSTDMSMTHLGFSMVPLNSSDWLSLRVRGELTISSLSVDATGGVTGLDVEVTRQRVLVEPTIKDLIANDRHQLVLAGELGFRSDSTSVKGIANPNVGGLPDGAGTELGMKLGYSWRNFDVQVGFRQLSVGADSTGEQYDEDGFYFSLTMGTLFNERGWTASLRPFGLAQAGDTGSSTDRLWQATQVSDLSANSNTGSSNGSMQAQLSYGMLSPFGASGLLIPYSQVRTSDSGATSATFGMNLNLNSGWQLHWQYANSTNSRGASRSASTAQSANDNGGEFKLGAALDF